MHTSPTAASPLLGRWYLPPLPAASGFAHQLATQFPNLTAQQAQSILASMRSLSSAQHLQAATHTQPQASQRTTSESVTPMDSIVTAATALGNPYTNEGVEPLCILPYTSVNVHVDNGQRLIFNTVNGQNPENQHGQWSKH